MKWQILALTSTVYRVKVVHIFICYSALSLDAAQRITAHHLEGQQTRLLALFPVSDRQAALFGRAFMLTSSLHSLSEWVKPFVIASWFRKVLISLELAEDDRLVVYAPHPFELPANYFIYSEPRVVQRELLPDGLLNYTRNHFKPTRLETKLRYATRLGLRIVAAYGIGLSYRPLRDEHLTQYESVDYVRCWTDNPTGFVTCRSELKQLPSRETSSDIDCSSEPIILVLDQELTPLVSAELEASLRQAMAVYLLTLGRKITYKAHPRGKNRSQELAALGLSVSDVTGEEIVERFILRHQVSHLVGFYSTPLLLSGDRVGRRDCILPRPEARGVKSPAQVIEYVTAMRASGANVSLHS